MVRTRGQNPDQDEGHDSGAIMSMIHGSGIRINIRIRSRNKVESGLGTRIQVQDQYQDKDQDQTLGQEQDPGSGLVSEITQAVKISTLTTVVL